ncbi:MAG: ATP-binding protein [Leptolyngbyaceae cyanobacterium bins.302]|nr:ATP-binding protein [Leptolyngbyaceae cyanobacterium bins.302]
MNLTLPASAQDLDAIVPSPTPQQLTVLLIDDQTTVHQAVHEMLAAEADISYHYCHDADLALQKAIEIAPTVILQDLIMPEVDGMSLVKQFRAHPETADIPIIMLSTNEEPVTKADAFAIGVNDYLVKLPDQIELIARVRYHSRAYLNREAHTAALVAQAHAKELEQTLEELHRTQTQLIQTEKLSSLGQMLAGVAHEINNPVGFIFGNLTYIDTYVQDLLHLVKLYQETYPEPESAIRSHLDEMDFDFIQEDLLKTLQSTRMGVERIVQIVLSLRNFSRHDHTEMKPSNIHEGIDSTLLILGHRLKQGIEVTKHYGDLPQVKCFQAQLNQVFMNILNNAIDALLEQAQIDRHISIQTTCIPANSGKTNDCGRIEIRIQDNGPGIPYDVQTKLFDPFFTTKPVGKGTGLGLSICQQIIKNHHGNLRVVSDLGYGTEFIIQLPIQ